VPGYQGERPRAGATVGERVKLHGVCHLPREGRRVYYSVVPSKPLRSELVQHRTVGQLLELIAETAILDRSESEAAPARSQSG
jgi:hypothetical protein